MNTKTLTFTVLSAFMASVGISNADVVSPWPPITTDRHAPQNMPIPHPAPAIDVSNVPSAIAFRALSLSTRYAVQNELIRMGMYPGEADGIWGVQTFAGTRAYASSLGMERRMDNVQGSNALFLHISD